MDIDKPLDDIIAANRPKSRSVGPKGTRSRAPPAAAGAGADRKRNDRETRRDAPYARPPPRSTEDKWVHDAYTGPGRGRALRSRDAERETAGVQFVGASPRIEVSGLHYEVTVEELKGIFEQAGTIVQGPTIRYDRSGRSTGIATIEYATAQQAKAAINQFDGAMTKGQTIGIKPLAPARAKKDAKSGSGSGSGSLLDRLSGSKGKGDLSSRIGGARESRKAEPRKAEPRKANANARPEPPRGDKGRRRDAPRARPKRPATTDDLDKELDGFMKPAGDDVAME